MTITTGLTYNKKTGTLVTLQDALALTGLTLAQLSQKASDQLKIKLGEDFIFAEGVSAKPENFSSFVVTSDNVTFILQPYQVAAYAAGEQEISVPRVK